MNTYVDIKKDLFRIANKKKSKLLSGFFKTGVGQYGEGDIFIGITVPKQREVAKKYKDLPLSDVVKLLHSKEHECRLTALIILVDQYKHSIDRVGAEAKKKKIFDIYLSNTKWINNWDLVDLSCHQIVGAYLADKDKSILLNLAHSKNLWERRIAIISTFAFIRECKYETSFRVAKILMKDEHDLIHKAVGWMLREIGKRCGREVEMSFLDKHHKTMPRTMLRYAIEHFSSAQKRTYMEK